MAQPPHAETHSFQTEIQQLLHLLVHSLYSHKEVFLRELISNASDAQDRLRFAALTDKSLLEDGDELAIRISCDNKRRTVTVSDNGIGMTRDEVVENIGTIARSGTRQFVEALSGDQSADANLIGQFGVGFYSVFMVADKVTLTTRKAGMATDAGVRWISDGTGEYTLEDIDRPERGTTITLHLRKGEKEFLEAHRLRSIVTKYSDHISLPIQMPAEAPPVEDTGAKPATPSAESGGEPNWEVVNRAAALWTRPKSEISKEEYDGFYESLCYDPEPPLATLHNRVEGKLEYTSLLFVPSRAPFDLWDRDQRHGIKLYVRRIFIMDDAKYLMPSYLRFVRGVVDAADLPLNVSREFLQHNDQIDKIRAASVRKILSELRRLAAKEDDQYATFWKEFGRCLKEGIVEDAENRDAIAKLLRFSTTKDESPVQATSLDAYIGRMPLKQQAIYYITGENHSAAKDSPHLEIFRKRGIEVLLLSDPIDEWLVTHLGEYDGKTLKSVAKGALDLDAFADETSREQEKKQEDACAELVKRFEEILKDKVKEVRVSHRLTDSPACLVADEHDLGANLQRILKAVGQSAPTAKPIMEINPAHAMIRNLQPDDAELEDWALVLFDQAALSEGAPLEQPAAYVRRINALLTQAAGWTASASNAE